MIGAVSGFGTIRNNTALKRLSLVAFWSRSFGTIRNNTALKHWNPNFSYNQGFGTIRNNTALKHGVNLKIKMQGFGTIRNNTALKPRRKIFLTKFRNRAINLSQTSVRQVPVITLIIPYFQGSRSSLDLVHTAENHRLFEVQQIIRLFD